MASNVEYVRKLLAQTEEYLAAKSVDGIIGNLVPSNNGHSGWTNDVSLIFYDPATKEEQELANELREVLRKAVTVILETASPTRATDGYIALEYCATFLYRVGKAVDQDSVTKLEFLITESQKLGAPVQLSIARPALEYLSELKT